MKQPDTNQILSAMDVDLRSAEIETRPAEILTGSALPERPRLPGSQILQSIRQAGTIEADKLIDLYRSELASAKDIIESVSSFLKKTGYKEIHSAFVVAFGLAENLTLKNEDQENLELCRSFVRSLCARPEASTLECCEVTQNVPGILAMYTVLRERFGTKLSDKLKVSAELKSGLYGDKLENSSLDYNGVRFTRLAGRQDIVVGKDKGSSDCRAIFILPRERDFEQILCAGANSLGGGPADLLPGSVGCLGFYVKDNCMHIYYMQGSFKSEGAVPVKVDTLKRYHDFRERLVEAVALFAGSRGIDTLSIEFDESGKSSSRGRSMEMLTALRLQGFQVTVSSARSRDTNSLLDGIVAKQYMPLEVAEKIILTPESKFQKPDILSKNTNSDLSGFHSLLKIIITQDSKITPKS